MLPTEFYKVLHVLGILLLFATLGGLAVLGLRGGDDREVGSLRKQLTIGHGVAMLMVFVAGFGMMARLGIMSGWPTWIYIKIALWLVLGAAVALVRRVPEMGRVWLVLLPLVGAAAAWVAFTHPPV
ncbi:MAG: hypothetical protein KDK70_26750 [Myxococcales bacterium]|nr:hypothetical protein [Myxococcales bacterium]